MCRIQTTILWYSSSPDDNENRESFYHVILSVLQTMSRARFLSLAWSKLRLCSVNHRAGYFQSECGEFFALFCMENNVENSPHYGWDAENWECWDVPHVISVLWLKCGYNADISSHSCPNTPICIFSAFPPHFFHIRMRRFLHAPVRILPSAFSPHFLHIFFHIFFHIRMRRFLCVSVLILQSAFSPQEKCIDLGYRWQEL